MPREPKCEGCGKRIIAPLSEVSNANGWLCLECSGAVLDDFLEEGVTEEDYGADHVHLMRTFHGH